MAQYCFVCHLPAKDNDFAFTRYAPRESYHMMTDQTVVESSFSAVIDAPIERVNIPDWCFTLPESEYQACSPAHFSATTTTGPDRRRRAINAEALKKGTS
jgi:hypothetical protein